MTHNVTNISQASDMAHTCHRESFGKHKRHLSGLSGLRWLPGPGHHLTHRFLLLLSFCPPTFFYFFSFFFSGLEDVMSSPRGAASRRLLRGSLMPLAESTGEGRKSAAMPGLPGPMLARPGAAHPLSNAVLAFLQVPVGLLRHTTEKQRDTQSRDLWPTLAPLYTKRTSTSSRDFGSIGSR